MLGKKKVSLQTQQTAPPCTVLLCYNVAGVVFFGLCTALGDFSRLVPRGGFLFVVLFLARSKRLGAGRHQAGTQQYLKNFRQLV